MEDGGDAVGDGLTITLEQRDIERKRNAGPWHYLAFKGVSVNVDDSGKNEKATGVDRTWGCRVQADAGDASRFGGEVHAGVFEAALHQRAPALDAKFHLLPRYE